MGSVMVPYTEGMRIGMGYNTYTQKLCTNDVVRRPGGKPATEADLRPVDITTGLPKGSQGQILDGSGGGTSVRKLSDGQLDTAQVVKWEAGFIDHAEDIAKSLSVSGAFQIKCDAAGLEGQVNAAYTDASKHSANSAKYNITVSVVNQKSVAEDVNVFNPIPNIPESKFTEVYGDSFISGFLEGGLLNALITRSADSDMSSMSIAGSLKLSLKLEVVDAGAQVSADYKKQEASSNTKTNVSVSWAGGGDIKPDSIREWDIPTVTSVAMEFPDRVAVCPQRTFAIVTKYSSLRSFHEQTIKGSPMDYEIAGVYTNSLLSDYMDYKRMWTDLHQTIKEVEERVSGVHKQKRNDRLIAYAQEAQKDYDQRMARYNDAKEQLAKSPSLNKQLTLQAPMPNNKLEPYDSDVFGLDQACRDLRFEMIKIVHEINAVTSDPQVAVDPNRNFRYLSPTVFRMVIPTNKEPMPTLEEIAENQAKLQKQIDDAVAQVKQEKDERAKEAERWSGLQGQLNATAAERDGAKAENENVRRERDYANTERDNARHERDTARDETQRSYQQAQKATSDYNQLVKWSNSDRDLYITRIIYGEKSLLQNQDVYNSIAQAVHDHATIQINNDLFRGDPLPGVGKTALITYQRKGQKPVSLEVREGQGAVFVDGDVSLS